MFRSKVLTCVSLSFVCHKVTALGLTIVTEITDKLTIYLFLSTGCKINTCSVPTFEDIGQRVEALSLNIQAERQTPHLIHQEKNTQK